MTPLRGWGRRLRTLFDRRGSDAALDDEVQFHLEMETAELEWQGAGHGDAQHEARRRFGSVDRYTEELRDERGSQRIDALTQDFRYALRLVRRAPAFASMVMVTLGLAIGATTAVFSVVHAVLLAPLPFDRPDEIVRVYAQNPDSTQPRFSVSHADYLDWQRETRAFKDLALFGNTTLTLTGDAEPERLSGLVVTTNFFSVLGVRPALGRLFGTDEAGEASSVVLTHALWVRRFGGDSSLVGKSIPFGASSRTVIGVLPGDFQLDGRSIDAVISLSPTGIPGGQNHGQHLFESIARLRPGTSVAQAHQELRAVAARVASQHEEIRGWSANVFSFESEMVRGTRDPLLVLLAAALLVLLIGCMNVANLLAVRASSRGREVGLRHALGASRGRITSQLLIESGVLAALGGALGIVLAIIGTRAIITLVPAGTLPRFDGSLNAAVLAFAALLSIATALAVGLWPARRASAAGATRSFREHGRAGTGGTSRTRARRVLVVAEVSLALVLLVCAGLVMQSLRNITNVDPGFAIDNISTMRMSLAGPRYANDTAIIAFQRALQEALEHRPGISAAAAANTPPIAGGGIVTPIRLVGKPVAPNGQVTSPMTAVTPGYFGTMSMRIIRGREPAWADSRPTIVASEAAAKRLWPGEDPIGKRVAFGRSNDESAIEVVGIVTDAHSRGLTSDPTPMLYLRYDGAASVARTMSLVVRGTAGPTAILAATKSVLAELDPTLPIFQPRTVREIVDQSFAQPRLSTTLLAVFAALALTLAAIGVYGVVSFSVAQRVQEFGVRMALGAQRRDVLRLVLGESAVLAAIGIVIGTTGAAFATLTIRNQLFGIARGDVKTFVATAVGLAAITLIAAFVPARRATRVDPVLAMRGE